MWGSRPLPQYRRCDSAVNADSSLRVVRTCDRYRKGADVKYRPARYVGNGGGSRSLEELIDKSF